MYLLYIEGRETPSLYTGRGVSHLYKEERKTPSLYKGRSVSLIEEASESVSSLERGEKVSPLFGENRDSYKGRSASLLYSENAHFFFRKRRRCPPID